MNHPKLFLRLVAGLLILCGAISCSSDDPAAPARVADVNAYLASLPTWATYSPPVPDADIAVGTPVDSTEVVDGTTYECVTTHYSLTQTPERLVTLNPDVEVLWVGSLLQGSGYVGGLGSLAELPIRQRGPLTLAIDLLTGENTRTVADPDLASVGSAIGDLIQTASDAGHRAGSRIAYNEVSYHTLAEAALKLGFSAAYSGVTASAELAASVSVEKTSIMVTFTQQMFTVSQVLPQTPGEMFSSAFTEDLLQEQVSRGRLGPNNLPVYATERMARFLTGNAPWSELVRRKQISVVRIEPNRELVLTPNLKVTPVQVPHRDELSDTVAYLVEGPERRLLWLPDIDKWEKWSRRLEDVLGEVDYAFVDATFYSPSELPDRDISEIPHPLVIETAKRVKAVRDEIETKIFLIHMNHSNPLLGPTGDPHRDLEKIGIHIASEGLRVRL